MDNSACSAFMSLMSGRNVRKANGNQDKFQHIDYFVDGIGVDVKSAKKFSDEGKFLIELVNVAGQRGWLFGKADVIAFQDKDGFIMVDRNKLYKTLQREMSMKVYTKGRFTVEVAGRRSDRLPCMAPNWYRREDRRKEMITYVGREVLEECLADSLKMT